MKKVIRTIVEMPFDTEKKYVEMFGKSGDTKPVTGIVTGSKFTEVNTGDVYLFDETSDGTWTKVAAGWTDPDA